MIVDFFRRGTGMSTSAVDYLLGKDRNREYASLLQGNVQEVSDLIDTSPYQKKYTAGVLSFYEHDFSDEVKKEIMQNFEKTLFPGLEPDAYRILWIQHQDKLNEETGERRLELNFLIPNVEIHSGKRLQPYYVGADFDRVDLFKQITNYKYDLYDPDDPINRRATKVAKNLPENAKELKTALEIEIALAIGEGLISDRKSLVKWLSDIGLEVTRETPKGISIKNPDDAKARPIRLTGAMYEQNFRYTDESPRITAEASERYRAEGAGRFNEGCARYEILLETKSEYHRSRYRQQQQPYFEPSEPSNDRAIAADRAERSEHQEPPTAGYDGAIAATARAVHQDQSELEKVQRLKPRNSTSNQFEKSTFHIEYSPDFSSLYSSYQQYSFWLHGKDESRRTQSSKSRIEERERELAGNANIARNVQEPIQTEISRAFQQEVSHDTRSSTVTDYRAATEAARERITAVRSASKDDCAVRELQQQVSAAQPEIEREKHRTRKDHSEAAEPPTFRELINGVGKRFKAALREPFDAVSEWVKHREPSETSFGSKLTQFSTGRNREADSTVNRANQKEIGLSTAISREIRGFNTEGLFKVLDELDRRKELDQKKEVEQSRGYDRF